MRKLSAATRETILQSAIRLFSEREVASVSTRAIAREARVSEATVFRYFPKKDEILETILTETTRSDYRQLEQLLDLVDDPREKLLAFCRQQAHFFCRHRALIGVSLREYLFQRPLDGRVRSTARHSLATLREVLREGVSKGVFRGDLDVATAAMTFHGISNTVLLHERISVARPYSETVFVRRVENLYRLYLRAILALP